MAYSPEEKHVIVVYHYVRDPSPEWGGIYPCSVAEFDRQVAFLSREYRVGSVADVLNAARAENGERVCAITFDDGTRDQYLYALPVLDSYKVSGTFFLISGVFEGLVPYTQKMHIVLSRFSIEELMDHFNAFAREHSSLETTHRLVPKDTPLQHSKRSTFGGDFRVDNFKEVVSTAPKTLRDSFLKQLLLSVDFTEAKLTAELFIDKSETGALAAKGHIIGSHTHTHEMFDTVNEKAIREDIVRSQRFFADTFGITPTCFAYPYGRFSEQARVVLTENGFQHAVTVERRGVSKADTPLLLPRYDTNDIRDFLAVQ